MFSNPRMPISRAASPAPGISRSFDGGPVRSPSVMDFQIEKAPKSPNMGGGRAMPSQAAHQDDVLLNQYVSVIIAAKDRQFAITGSIPLDPSQLVLFFRSKSGITHSLDFPIDVHYNTPPALDVLIAACRPHQTSDYDGYSSQESLFYPPNLPLTPSLEIANHPILDAVKMSLFPFLPPGQHLTAVRDKLEVLVDGAALSLQPPNLRKDGRSATIIVTLPVRHVGGELIVRDTDGTQESFLAKAGNHGEIEWVAFLADCEYEIQTVKRGCMLCVSYGVFLKNFDSPLVNAPTLISPSDRFFDLLAPILNMLRGRRIAFYVTHTYGIDPSQNVAESLIPQLKGADALIYNAFKMYKLGVAVHWTAGGYLWPVDRTIELSTEDITQPPHLKSNQGLRMPFGVVNGPAKLGGVPPVRGPFNTQGHGDIEAEAVRVRVEASGATLLVDEAITILTDWSNPAPVVGTERVSFVSNGELEKLVVNALLVVYVP